MASETDAGELVIDATLFMGMHSTDEAVRRGCKAFFADHLGGRVLMPLEQVGRCDDLVWGVPREIQDAYYPFMDVLHTDMKIDRFPYHEDDLHRAVTTAAWAGLPLTDRLTLACAVNRAATLVTVNPRLLAGAGWPVRTVPEVPGEASFPPPLEDLYRTSLALRMPVEKG